MGLKQYREKRRFDRTAEPEGRVKSSDSGRMFVVQKHAAGRLHYDFRLEMDGVLKSWAVPKGPSLDPSDRRLAVQVEDHPLEYGDFEGIIPENEYGGGTVMVWDRGEWEPEEDFRKGYREGRLKFRLKGQKLQGRWILAKMAERGDEPGKNWLLIKAEDQHAGTDDDLLEKESSSVLTGRTMDEISADRGGIWSSNREDKKADEVVRERLEKTPPDADENPRTASPGTGQSGGKPPRKKSAGGEAGIRLANPDRIFYPDHGITKAELIAFYQTVADRMLPHVSGRPLMIVRCPRGLEEKCFFQKHFSEGIPDAVKEVLAQEKEGRRVYFMAEDLVGILSLVQLGALEIHSWGSRADRLDYPDIMIFDMDPGPGVSRVELLEGCLSLKKLLDDIGLESFVKTSGGKGFHIVVPLEREKNWDEIKAFSKAVAEKMVRKYPKRFVSVASKAKRNNRIFVDYLRNVRAATNVAPFSTRARPGAPVSTPVAWDELDEKLKPDSYTVENLPRRLESMRQDPWSGYFDVRQSISASMERNVIVMP